MLSNESRAGSSSELGVATDWGCDDGDALLWWLEIGINGGEDEVMGSGWWKTGLAVKIGISAADVNPGDNASAAVKKTTATRWFCIFGQFTCASQGLSVRVSGWLRLVTVLKATKLQKAAQIRTANVSCWKTVRKRKIVKDWSKQRRHKHELPLCMP